MGPSDGRIRILMYHQIAVPEECSIAGARYCVPPRLFALQMLYLRLMGYSPVTISRVGRFFRGEASLPRKPIAITFDDGYLDTYTHAAPILRRFGMNATMYLVGGCMGSTNRSDEAEGHATARLMSGKQVLDLARHGFEFGVHTMTHPRLVPLSRTEMVREIAYAKGYLEEMLGLPMESFSYPYGDASFNRAIRGVVKKSGFLAAVGTDPGCNTRRSDRYNLSRLFPKSYTNLARFHSLMDKMPCDYQSAYDYWA